MTKMVRVENADTSAHKVVLQTWDKGADGGPDILVKEERLDHPTALKEIAIWSTRYLLIREVE